jgi:hypothetical protein
MKTKLVVVVAVVCGVLIAGLAAAQEPTWPEGVVEKLVNDGYLQDSNGSVVAEKIYESVSANDYASKLAWKWSLGEDSHRDLVMGSTILWGPGEPEDSCGFIFRQQDDQNFYVVHFNREGVMRLVEMKDGSWLAPINVDVENVALDDETDSLWLVAQGDIFEVFVNGEHVVRFRDDTLATGKVALALNAVGNSSTTRCTFLRSWLWEKASAQAGLFGGSSAKPTATPAPTEAPAAAEMPVLVDYDKPIGEAVAELERVGLIPTGGNEIFREPYAYFEGTGSWFTSLASYNPHTQIIFAGSLTFHRGDTEEPESCSLMSRIIMSGNTATTFLQVGLTSNGLLFAADIIDGERNAFGFAPIRVNLDEPHHILYMALRDRLTVYFDGQPVLQDLEIQERAGTYGIALLGRGNNARCEGRDLWAWQVDDVVSFGDQCGARASNTVNLRSGPGTDYDKAGTLEAGRTALIVGQATGSDGSVWWKLDSGNWVRSDVVTAGGNCSDVPVVEP